MPISCKNCGGHFTEDEMRHRRPPLHPWRLTPVGQQMQQHNQTNGGDPRMCPVCGCQTLKAA